MNAFNLASDCRDHDARFRDLEGAYHAIIAGVPLTPRQFHIALNAITQEMMMMSDLDYRDLSEQWTQCRTLSEEHFAAYMTLRQPEADAEDEDWLREEGF